MKIEYSDFILTETKGKNALDFEYFANIDVCTTTGFFKKKHITETKKIRKTYAGHWHFVDTGKFTTGSIVEELARAWTAQTGQAT